MIHEEYHDHGISRATFKRMLGKAKRLGILTIYETERGNGSQESNLYVFNRFQKKKRDSFEELNRVVSGMEM